MKNRIALGLGLTALALWIGAPAGAQDATKTGAAKKERASPHEDVSASIGDKKITISYGRPFKKNPTETPAPVVPSANAVFASACSRTTFCSSSRRAP